MYKIKKIVFVALAITALTMTGCSSETPAPLTTPTGPAAPTAPAEAQFMPNEIAPTPDEAQAQKLLADLGNVNPSLNTPVSVERARAVCEDIIAGKSDSELAPRVSAVFSAASDGPLSEPQIADVLKAIKDNGFCK